MVKCNFCNKSIPRGTGKMIVKIDGKVLNMCSMKCEKNMTKLKRKAIETRWSGQYKKGEAK